MKHLMGKGCSCFLPKNINFYVPAECGLLNLPDHPNPATALALQIKFLEITGKLDLDTLIALQPRIEEAIEAGREGRGNVARALRRAIELSPVPSSIPVFGV